MPHTEQKYLLSIDGGGIRGILAVMALMKLEQTTGKLSRDTFSFVAGTSTGAIIAAGVAAGIPAKQILHIYTDRAPEIFTKRPWNILKRVFTGHIYSTKKLHDIIKEELSTAAQWTINDSPIDILIGAKRVSDGVPFYFVKDNKQNSCSCGHLSLVDCVTASSAAPTYFHPWEITQKLHTVPPISNAVGRMTDGGIGVAGNPVYQACVEAFYYTEGYPPEHTTIVSLGTGRFLEINEPHWLWPWLEWILEESLSSPGEQQTEIVQRHFPQTRFYRLDPDLRKLDPTLKHDIPLDDTSHIHTLLHYGEKFTKLIDWKAILEGTDTSFRVTDKKTQWYQYNRP